MQNRLQNVLKWLEITFKLDIFSKWFYNEHCKYSSLKIYLLRTFTDCKIVHIHLNTFVKKLAIYLVRFIKRIDQVVRLEDMKK